MLGYDEFAKRVEWFTRSNQESEDFSLGEGTATLRYVKNGDLEYRASIAGMFGFDEVYEEYPGDFILFYINGELQAIGTYSPDYGTAWVVDEVDDMVKTFRECYLAFIHASEE